MYKNFFPVYAHFFSSAQFFSCMCSFSILRSRWKVHCIFAQQNTHSCLNTSLFFLLLLFYSLNKFVFFIYFFIFLNYKNTRNSKLHLRICNGETCGKRKHLRESIRFMKKEMLMGWMEGKKEFDDFSIL